MFKVVKTVHRDIISRFILKFPLFPYSTKLKQHDDTTNYEVSDKSTDEIFLQDFKLYKNFITPSEEDALFNELEPHLKRLRYEKSHWDDAIHNYRETEKLNWHKCNKPIIDKMHLTAFGPTDSRAAAILRQTHILDLAETGFIKPHVDSVKFCGTIVAGLSLLSDCVIRFVKEVDHGCWINTHLPRYSFYVMRGNIRHLFTHEILTSDNSHINGVAIPKTRRISLMCRNEPLQQTVVPPVLDKLMRQWSEKKE